MARPERNSVDYFPFICSEGKKMYYLEETYGNDGFAVFVKLLRELAKTEYHYLNLSENTTLMFLSAKCKVSKVRLELIIQDLVDLDKFNSMLWSENKIIWCQDFIDSIQDAYIKRKNNCITFDGLLQLLIGLGVRKQGKSKLKSPVKPQSIVEDIIVEDIYSIFDFFIDDFKTIWFDEFLPLKKKKKGSLTDRALTDQMNTIKKLSDNDYTTALEILKKSVNSGWTDFYPLKSTNKSQTHIQHDTDY